jgi:Protein of unknown function (DUF551)
MKWTDTKKKLPKNYTECLVASHIMPGDAGCGYGFHMATYINKKFLTWELGNVIENVSHWMPLPKDPDQ